ncbi:MAG: homogentisate 1,2-dioxygenase [Candidatus Binataceae bacterium]|nr:homogentisate 1,2-dioxygenase [Candidatus Binataceae bacterium]
MIHYSKGKVARQAHVGIPEGVFEEEHGRQGFAGRVSQFYHLNPPNEWTRIEGPLRPRGINTYELETPDRRDPKGGPLSLFYNEDVKISLSRRSAAMPFCFRNADGDELHFIHQGTGLIRTEYGPVRYEPGDYIVIPKGTNYQVLPDGSDNFSLILQARGEIEFPDRGNVGHYAPFDYGVVETPEPEAVANDGREWELRIKRSDQITSLFYNFCPLDVVGWKGNLTVTKLNVRDIRPLMSEGVHLPPSAHCTFQAPGVAICTFNPRPLEGDPRAERIPWYHRNIDVDEVFFVHGGSFSFSGRPTGRGAGVLTLNPQGLHHGPKRADLEAARKEWRKDARLEGCAVNIDCNKPLEVSPEADAPGAKFAF